MQICKGCGNEFEPRHNKDHRCATCYSKLGKRSKGKGASNERRFFKKLQALFDKYDLKYKVRRTPRSGAIHEFEPADGLFSNLPTNSIFKAHFELKDVASWSIDDWVEKAETIEKERETYRPFIIVARKPSYQRELAIVDSDFLIKLMIELELYRFNKNE